MGLPEIVVPADLVGAALVVVGLPLGDGLSPAAVRRAATGYAGWAAPLRGADYGDASVAGDDLAGSVVQAHEGLVDVVAAGAVPLILGGDALVTVPALQVLSGKLRGRLGLVAFSPRLEIAVDPVYAAASRWARALELGIVAPSNLVLIGARPGAAKGAARSVLDGLGAHVFSITDVEEHGMRTLAQEALEAAAAGTEALYLSVDVDVLAGAPDPVGLMPRELAAGAAVLASALLAGADVCGSAAGDPSAAARIAAEIVMAAARRGG